jgi:hypothetical protein
MSPWKAGRKVPEQQLKRTTVPNWAMRANPELPISTKEDNFLIVSRYLKSSRFGPGSRLSSLQDEGGESIRRRF